MSFEDENRKGYCRQSQEQISNRLKNMLAPFCNQQETCRECGGDGTLAAFIDGYTKVVNCWRCRGSGAHKKLNGEW